VDLESVGCHRHLRGAGLVGSALWADAVSREEMSGHSTRRELRWLPGSRRDPSFSLLSDAIAGWVGQGGFVYHSHSVLSKGTTIFWA
jgi:hypothetical protein